MKVHVHDQVIKPITPEAKDIAKALNALDLEGDWEVVRHSHMYAALEKRSSCLVGDYGESLENFAKRVKQADTRLKSRGFQHEEPPEHREGQYMIDPETDEWVYLGPVNVTNNTIRW
jgi:hypothetical protein